MATSCNVKGTFQEDTTHIYYNLSITNNNTGYDQNGQIMSITPLGIPANYQVNRTNPYLYNPDDYDMTVVRMDIDNNSVPIQIVEPICNKTYITNPTIPNPESLVPLSYNGFPTVYIIHIRNMTTNQEASINVLWNTTDFSLQPPNPSKPTDLGNPYFYNYNIETFLDAVNNGIMYLMAPLISVQPTSPAQGNLGSYPYFSSNDNDDTISFNAPITFMNNELLQSTSPYGNTCDTWNISLSEPLYNLFSGLPAIKQVIPSAGNLVVYQLLITPYPDNSNVVPQYRNLTNTPALTQTGTYIVMTQLQPTLQLWNPVSSVIIKAVYFPTVAELVAKPYITGVNPNIIDVKPISEVDPSGNITYTYPCQNNNSDIMQTIFDFNIINKEQPETNFVPAAEYRLSNIIGIQPISDINVQTFWKDTYGILHPFLLEQGSSLSVKLLFRRKDFRNKERF